MIPFNSPESKKSSIKKAKQTTCSNSWVIWTQQ